MAKINLVAHQDIAAATAQDLRDIPSDLEKILSGVGPLTVICASASCVAMFNYGLKK